VRRAIDSSGVRGAEALVVALVVALAGAGCGGPPATEAELNQALFANDQTAYDYFVGKGLASFQSAGIVGNLDQESGVDPAAVQYGGGPGRGIAQWSVGGRWDTSGNDNVVWFANQKGQSPWSLGLQLDFIWYELTTFGYGFGALKGTTNVTDATVVFQDDYEICGACAQSQRIAYAQAVLNAYGRAPDWAAKYVSQSWPLATTALTIQCGEDVPANIVLRNAGAATWDANTKLGTTQPRDRASIFVGSDWLAPNRAAHVSGTVAPGGTFQFAFTFHGPTGAGCAPGDYHEFFDLVEEGVAWFGDPGQGGPPDNDIEVWIKLVPAPESPDMARAEDLGAAREPDGGVAREGDGGAARGLGVHGGCSAVDGGRATEPASPLMLVFMLFALRLLSGMQSRRRGA